MRFSLHKKFLFILFGDLNWIFFKDLNAKKVTMENRISVLPDINMEVGGGNLGRSAKPMTMAQEAPHGGLSIRWETFSPRELA
ncbi:hypothetical protein Gotur_031559 [Gossypium turneri]